MPNKTLEKWEEKTLEDILDKGSSNFSANKLSTCEGDYPIYGASGLVKRVNFYQQEKEYLAIIKDGAGVGRVYHYEPKSSILGTLQYLFPKENVNIRFAYYYLQSLDFAKYYQGAAIPHIYYKDYKNEKLVLPPLPEQQRIVRILDEAFEDIEKAKQNALQNLNDAKELFESYLINTFLNNNEFLSIKIIGIRKNLVMSLLILVVVVLVIVLEMIKSYMVDNILLFKPEKLEIPTILLLNILKLIMKLAWHKVNYGRQEHYA